MRGFIRILYASQTGTAKDGAEYVSKALCKRCFTVQVGSLAAWTAEQLVSGDADISVFVVSTTGDGEFPDNSRTFWRQMLRRDLPADMVHGLSFTAFGFGDSAYEKYNAAARKLWNRLLQLGGSPCCARGLGDDSSPRGLGAEGDLDRWLDGTLLPALDAAFPMPEGMVAATGPLRVLPRYQVTWLDDTDGVSVLTAAENRCRGPVPFESRAPAGAHSYAARGGQAVALPADAPDGDTAKEIQQDLTSAVTSLVAVTSRLSAGGPDPVQPDRSGVTPLLVTVVENTRMTAQDWSQDVRHIAFKLPAVARLTGHGQGHPESTSWSDCLAWRAGDVAVVYPENPSEEVERLAARLGLGLDRAVAIAIKGEDGATAGQARVVLDGHGRPSHVTAFGPPHALPPAVTIRSLLTRYVDICGIPRRGVLEQLSLYATDEEQAEKLLEMSGAAGTDIYTSYCGQEKRTLYELLCDFDSVRDIPLEVLLELLPPLQPRHFSIASSAAGPGGTLDLCVAVVSYSTKRGRRKRGLCSNWLAGLQPGAQVCMWVQPGTFTLPALPQPSSPEAVGCARSLPPLVLVGPGTGIAPMRSIVQEWQAWWRAVVAPHGDSPSPAPGQAGQSNGDRLQAPSIMLYFGCRRRETDWLYSQELRQLVGDVTAAAPVTAVTDSTAVGSTAVGSTAVGSTARPGDAAPLQPYYSWPGPVHTGQGPAGTAPTTAVVSVQGTGAASIGTANSVVSFSQANDVSSDGNQTHTTVLRRYEVAFSRDPVPTPGATAVATAVNMATAAAAAGAVTSGSNNVAASAPAPTLTAPFRVYVQSLLRRPARAREIGELLLDTHAKVCIAGSANKMPQDVIGALKACVRSALRERAVADATAQLRAEAGHACQAQPELQGQAHEVDAAAPADVTLSPEDMAAIDADIDGYMSKWTTLMERQGRLTVEAWS